MSVTTFVMFIVVIILIASIYGHFANLKVYDSSDDYEITKLSIKNNLFSRDLNNVKEEKAYTHEYNQYNYVGWLYSTDMGEKTIVLPLFGKKMPDCDRFVYFTTYKHTTLPVQYENKACDVENVGCAKITNGAKVIIPEYANKVFTFKSN